MKITEAHRIAAREEQERKRKMSAKALGRLREMAAERQRNDEANVRFISEFIGLRKDDWTMRLLLERISRPAREKYMSPAQIEDYYTRRCIETLPVSGSRLEAYLRS